MRANTAVVYTAADSDSHNRCGNQGERENDGY